MSILTSPFAPAARRTRPSAFATLSALWTDTVRAWRIRKADHAMHSLSDAMLHDIGVARSEIEEATRHGRAGLR